MLLLMEINKYEWIRRSTIVTVDTAVAPVAGATP